MGNYLENLHQPVGLQDGHEIKKSNMQDQSRVTFQSEDSLDLTTSDQVVLSRVEDDLEAPKGYDSARAIKSHFEVTTKINASTTAPTVNIEDASGNSTGLAHTGIADNDSDGAMRVSDVSGGSKVKGVDLSAESLVAATDTVADGGVAGTAGTGIVWVEVVPQTL